MLERRRCSSRVPAKSRRAKANAIALLRATRPPTFPTFRHRIQIATGPWPGTLLAHALFKPQNATACRQPHLRARYTPCLSLSDTMTPLLRRQLVVVPLSVLLGFLLASVGFRNGLDQTVFGSPYDLGGGYNALGKVGPFSKWSRCTSWTCSAL